MGVSYKTEVNGALIPLGEVDVIAVFAQIGEYLALTRIFIHPVPVDLADIFRHAAGKFGGHGVFPAGPGGKRRADGNGRVLLHKSGDGFLVGLVAGLAAPPAHAQGHFAVGGLGGNSGRRGCGGRGAAASAGGQQAGRTGSAGSFQKLVTGDRFAHGSSSCCFV